MENLFRNKKIMAIIGIIIVLISVGFIGFTLFDSNKEEKEEENKAQESEKVNNEVDEKIDEDLKELKIVDVNSNSRPVAIMINNLNAARPYQSGLQDAYIVYEIIVEGGITRMMALFKDKDTSRIGSVRSSRHYFLDYALENDAIYVHFGWSPQAQTDISSLSINNVNGLYDDAFWRESYLPIAYEHTAFTSIDKIMSVAKNKGYKTTSNKDLLLNYTTEEVDLSKNTDSSIANSVEIKYSNYATTSYVYNKNEKLYYRSVNNKAHTDYVTKKQFTTKNIIIAYVSNEDIPGDTSGRQNLNNIGSGSGFYITNGSCVPITWEKKTRSSQTVYKYKDGTEIDVSDGNTFIQIAPKNSAKIK